jgi:cytochrome c oxidase cbb3-type subunit 4
MSFGTLQGIGTILAMIAFIGVCWWAYGSKRKARFDEAALLPFADDDVATQSARKPSEPAPRSSRP